MSMNEREKIIQAIEEFHAAQQALRDAEKQVGVLRLRIQDREHHLCKTLHAVLGTRCEEGALLHGKRYVAKLTTPGHYQLEITHMGVEVLG